MFSDRNQLKKNTVRKFKLDLFSSSKTEWSLSHLYSFMRVIVIHDYDFSFLRKLVLKICIDFFLIFLFHLKI